MFNRTTAFPLTLLVTGMTLAVLGCGTSGPSGVKPSKRPTGQGGTQPGTPPVPAILPTGNAAQLLAAYQQAWGNTRTIVGSYEFWEKKGSEIETASVKMYFQKPSKYRLEVAKATSSIKNGSTSVFDTHTRKINSRLGGALSLIPINGTLDDDRTLSVRRWKLDETDYATQAQLFFAPGAPVVLVPGGAGPTLELAHPAKYPGIDALRITLDPQKLVPLYFEMTERGQVIYKRRFASVQVNSSVSSDKFNL